MILIETLMEQLKPNLHETWVENGDKLFLIALLEIRFFSDSRISKFWCKDQRKVSMESSPAKSLGFDWVFDGKNQMGSQKESWVRISRWIIIKSSFQTFLIVEILKQGTNPLVFQLNSLVQVQRCGRDLYDWFEILFAGENWVATSKKHNTSWLFGFSSIWGSQTDMFNQKHFWNSFSF